MLYINVMKELHRGLLPDGSSESFVKRSIRFAAKKAVPLAIIGSLTLVACGGGDKNSDSVQPQSAPRPSESGTLLNPENPFAILGMPFPGNKDMAIQQGWQYTEFATQDGKKEHNGIDFIKGSVDNSRTWKSFPVLAVADGKACANPPSRQGNAILITHSIGETPIGSTYYGHLQKSEKDIPQCSTGQTVSIHKGDKIGDAGSTGAQDQSWIHLHFQVNDANGNPIDPYDLQGEREVYPDPNFKNGKPCGPNALFIDCYPKGAVVAGPKDPIPPISATITSKEVFPVTPRKELPTPTPTEKLIEQGWEKFTSLNYPYRIDVPSGWTTKTTSFGGKQVDVFLGEISHNFQTNVVIFSEPVNSWVTTRDYVNNYLGQMQQVDKDAKIMTEGPNLAWEKNNNPPSIIKVGGEDAYIISSTIPEGALFFNPTLSSLTVAFVRDGKGWQITLNIDYYASDTYVDSVDLMYLASDRFQKMVESLRFLK